MITDLEQYIADPINVSFELDISTPRIIKCFDSLLSAKSYFYFIKVWYIKKLVSALSEDKKFRPFRFVIKRQFTPKAYMHDSGILYISYGMFLKTSVTVFVSVLCHELSHIWLSQQDFYPQLKQLNRQFKDKYSAEKDAILMSPIEVYARLVSTSMMDIVLKSLINERKKKKLQFCLNDQLKKLQKLKNMLAALQS